MAHTILLGISCHGSFVINYSKFGQVIQNMSYIGFFFPFQALVAILFNTEKPFVQFW